MSDDHDRSPRAAWSLEPGLAACEFCVCRYHIETACYCAHCDRPVCPLCVTRVELRGELLCPECAGGGED